MKQFYVRIVQLIAGLFVCAVGVAFTINARIGYSPWDAFHAGVAKTVGITIGTASISLGVLILAIVILLGEKIGIGSILNMILFGTFLDLVLGKIPVASNYITGALMMVLGMIIFSFGTYLYILAAFGAGPRDSLMVALSRKTGLPVGLCRGIIEFFAALAGWRLGGMIGFGTIFFAALIGFFIQTTFKLLNFDPTKIEHETIDVTIKKHFRARSV